MNRSVCSFLVLCLLVAVPASAQLFAFRMSGDQEVPPVSTTETGGCYGAFDSGTSSLTLTCVHDVADATVMHIHHGAAGATGAIAHDLGSPASPLTNTWSGMSPADVADLFAGNLYINIHTSGRPLGAIRGQIVPRSIDSLSFVANASQFVPPGSGTESASCSADLSNDATQLGIQCRHDVSPVESAEVHEAPLGVNGPVVYTFASAASPINENVSMTPQLVADFEAGFLYIEIHAPIPSEDQAGPQIRGQIATLPAAVTTGTIRIVKKTSPAGGSGFGFTDNVPGSTGSFTLDDNGVKTFSNVAPGDYAVTENDPSASSYTLTDIACDNNGSSSNPSSRTATVHVIAGESVTCTFTNLRTVVPTSLFVFHLSTDQEVPPTVGTDRGGCYAQFNAGTSTLALVCTHDVVDATVMHIHRGAPGVNGPVVFDLGSPVSPVEATWSGMSPADVADLLAGNLYVNIHSGGRPTGAIRGQIVTRSVDSVAFLMTANQEVPPTDSNATGQCTADLSDNANAVTIACTHNVPSPTHIHLHDAPPGRDGPIIWDYGTHSSISGTTPLTPRLVADFAAGFLYVNVHSVNYPEGEIRGQPFAPAALIQGAAVPTATEWGLIGLAIALIAIAARRM